MSAPSVAAGRIHSRQMARDNDDDDDAESPVGEFIRRQREMQELTMRQLAELV
jgi:hypothetical protein